MQKPQYFRAALWQLLVILPLLFQVFAVVTLLAATLASDIFQVRGQSLFIVSSVCFGLGFLYFCFRSGRAAVRIAAPPDFAGADRFAVRYLPVLLAFAYTLGIALIAVFLPIPAEGAILGTAAGVVIVAHLTSSLVLAMGAMLGMPSLWLHLLPPLAIYAAHGCGLAWGFRERRSPRTSPSGFGLAAALIAAALGVIVWRADFMMRGVIRGDAKTWWAEQSFNRNHRPFAPGNTLPNVSSPTLAINDNYPRLDGATAAFPVYAAAVQALYKGLAGSAEAFVRSSTTPEAYDRLIAGEADLIFVAQPSAEQLAQAEAAGHPLQLTALAREAFVFFVSADNPVDGLTSDQIRAIYTKRIVNWRELGGPDEPIIAFQRPAGSGSQTALELKVLRGEKPAKPLREEFAKGMGGVIQRVAAYQNSRQAIGYSFRVFATAMNPGGEIKLLKIDGVAPTRDTIRSGAYPYTVDVFAATAGSANPHVPELIAWFLGPQGQQLIEDTGYVSLPPTPGE